MQSARRAQARRLQHLEHRTNPTRTVMFPARQYSVNGERRNFVLLRTISGGQDAPRTRIQDLILQAYADFEASVPASEEIA